MTRTYIVAAAIAAVLTSSAPAQPTKVRIGHFPNITHAQALVASQLSRQGKGWFEEFLGPDVKVEYYVYNAGPSAMEAFFAGSIDLTYVGPNPVLNAYAKSKTAEVRVVAGATLGGAALVVRGDGGISNPQDFRGKKIATPQLGNTQDVACRAWLAKQGFRITQMGGDVTVLPTANPDQLPLFQAGKLDAVWTTEPWVSRAELEGNGKIFLEQKDDLGALLASTVKFQQSQPALLKRIVQAHTALTAWISEHPQEAKALVRAELKQLTKRDIAETVLDSAWPRLRFTAEISQQPFEHLVSEAQSVGFLKDMPDLGKLVIHP